MKNWGGWEVYIFIFFIFPTALMIRTVLKETFNTLNLNCQNKYMINIKCLNKIKMLKSTGNNSFSDLVSSPNMLARKIAPKIFGLFQTFLLIFHRGIRGGWG